MAESQPLNPPTQAHVEDDSGSDEEDTPSTEPTPSSSTSTDPVKKKKKKKRSKLAAVLKPSSSSSTSDPSHPASKLSSDGISSILDANPALQGELAHLPRSQAEDLLRKMDINQLLTGMSINNKNQKDMASYKFWQTQPVPRFDEKASATQQPDGAIKEVVAEKVPKEAAPLPEGYEWVELDLTQEAEIKEVYQLLTFHYVEDDSATFRFNYSEEFLDWALKAPGWKKSWHIGVRAKGPSKLLVATIFGIPTKIRARKNALDVVEINFLCIHKKLRSKRLAPVLIKEITRRCNLLGIYQAVYTAGVLIPTPVGTCRYFHRPLDWLKLYEVKFSPLPPNMTKAMMIAKNKVSTKTSTEGWREMKKSDASAVHDLLLKYSKRFDLAHELNEAEVEHWFLDKNKSLDKRVVWSFVTDGSDGKITDFISFYCLESSVIGEASQKHDKIRAAYLFYYASEHAFNPEEQGLKERLNGVVADALVEAKKAKFDVFNALTLLDNPLFLTQQRFGPGDGQLHYYLYNWRTPPMKGGLDKQGSADANARGGIGMVLL